MRKVLSHHGLRFSRDLAGYAAGGLTQPTMTIGAKDAGIKPWQRLTAFREQNLLKQGRLG